MKDIILQNDGKWFVRDDDDESAKAMKVTQEKAHYTAQASNPNERCAACQHFIQGGACAIVEGTISPDGWCEYFDREGAKAMSSATGATGGYATGQQVMDKTSEDIASDFQSVEQVDKQGYMLTAGMSADKTSADGDDDSRLVKTGHDVSWMDQNMPRAGTVESITDQMAHVRTADGMYDVPLSSLEPAPEDDTNDTGMPDGSFKSAKAGDDVVNESDDIGAGDSAGADKGLADNKSADTNFAYPDESKLPMPDAAHVVLAAAALGSNPPHGNRAKIPADKLGEVKGRIRARARALNLSSEDMAKVNAYLSGHMPPSDSKALSAWNDVYERVLAQTGDETKAALAAQGLVDRQHIVGVKSAGSDLPTSVEGWAVLFSEPDELDLQGTYFDEMTRTLVKNYANAPLWYEHGHDPRYGSGPIGERTATQVFPHGIWMAHKLYVEHPLYARTAQDALDGKLHYSSDSLSHYVAQGYQHDGYLGEWPLAGCSLTETPAEPGLGPVRAKSFEVALKSAIAQKREATGNSDEDDPQSSIKGESSMDESEISTMSAPEFESPETGKDTQTPDTIAAFAAMYGCEPDPLAVRAAMDSHIADMNTKGMADADLCKALGMDEGSEPAAVADNLNNLYSAAMGLRSEPEAVRNYDALGRHLVSAGIAAKSGKGPYMTDKYSGKTNFNVGAKIPGVQELVADMIRVKQGLTPRNAFKNANPEVAVKAMTSATGPTGGYVLRQEISEQILDPLRAQAVCFQLGATREDMQGFNSKLIPAMQSAPTSNWIGENQAVTTSQPAYRLITLVPHGLQTTVPIPVNVEANMTPNAEAQLREQMILSQTLAIDIAALTGPGGASSSGQGAAPVGILNTTGVRQMLLATNGRMPTYEDVVNANRLLDQSNVPMQGMKRGLAFHSDIEAAFTGQTDTLGNPLLRQSWAAKPEPTIINFPYRTENQIPTNITVGSTSTNSYVFFSDWRYLIIGLSDMVELRLNETFMQNLQVGLLAYIYADVRVAYPEAFIVMTGAQGLTISGVTVTTNS